MSNEKIQQHRANLNRIADVIYQGLGPAADEVLEDLQ